MEKRKVTKLPRRFSAFFMAMVMVLSLLVGISTTSYADAELQYAASPYPNVIKATKGDATAFYTLNALDVVWSSDLQYNGATVDIQGSVEGAPTAEDAKALITYKKENETVTISGDSVPGTYTAVLTLGGVTATEDFTISKANGPAAPTGLAGVAPTTAAGNNGKITGVTDDMEYKLADATNYTAVEANAATITGLTAGTYKVRFKSTTFVEAGADATVTINPYQVGSTEVAKPTAPADLVYTGSEIVAFATTSDYTVLNSTEYTGKATNAGTYTAQLKLTDSEKVWADTQNSITTVEWTIKPKMVGVVWTHTYVDKVEIRKKDNTENSVNWHSEMQPKPTLVADDVIAADKNDSGEIKTDNLGLQVEVFKNYSTSPMRVYLDSDIPTGEYVAEAELTGSNKDNYVIVSGTDEHGATFNDAITGYTVVDSEDFQAEYSGAKSFIESYSQEFPEEVKPVKNVYNAATTLLAKIGRGEASQSEINQTIIDLVTAMSTAWGKISTVLEKSRSDYLKAFDEVLAWVSKKENREKYPEIMKALDNPDGECILRTIDESLYGTSTSHKSPSKSDYEKATEAVKEAFAGGKNAIAFIEAAKKLPAADKVTLEDAESVAAVYDIYEKIPDVFIKAMLKNKDQKKLVENFEAVVTKLNELIKADEEAKKAAEEEAKKNAKIEVPGWVNYKGNIVAVDKNGKLVKKTGIATWKGYNLLIANGVLYKKPAFFLDKSTGKYKYFVNGIQAKTGDTFVYYGGKLLRVTNGEFNQETGFVKFGGKYYISYKGVAATFFTGTVTIKGYKVKVVKGAVVGISR